MGAQEDVCFKNGDPGGMFYLEYGAQGRYSVWNMGSQGDFCLEYGGPGDVLFGIGWPRGDVLIGIFRLLGDVLIGIWGPRDMFSLEYGGQGEMC